MGHPVEVKLYRTIDGAKQHSGVLCAYENGRVTIECGGKKFFEPADISSVRLLYTGTISDLQ